MTRELIDLQFAQTIAHSFGFSDPDHQVLLVKLTTSYAVGVRGAGWALFLNLEQVTHDDINVQPNLFLDPRLYAQHADWNRRWKPQPIIDAFDALVLRHLPVAGRPS